MLLSALFEDQGVAPSQDRARNRCSEVPSKSILPSGPREEEGDVTSRNLPETSTRMPKCSMRPPAS
jgi:hypothetical protein